MLLVPALAYADSGSWITRDKTLDEEYRRDSFYVKTSGEINDISLSIPLVNPNFDVVAYLLFKNITVQPGRLINDANLTLNFALDYTPTGDDIMVSVYGYDSEILSPGPIATASPPLTTAHKDVNLQSITSETLLDIDVTNIIQEIVNKNYWDTGDDIALVILGSTGAVSRSYQSNYGVKRPELSIRYGESPETPEGAEGFEFVESYKGYDIYNGSLGLKIYNLFAASDNRFSVFEGDELVLNSTDPTDANFWSENSKCVIGLDIYALFTSGTRTELRLYKSVNNGLNWTVVKDVDILGTKQDFQLFYNVHDSKIYVAYQEASDGYISVYDIETDSIESLGLIIDGYSSASGICVVADSESNIYVAQGSGLGGSSANRILYKQRVDGGWSALYSVTTTDRRFPELFIDEDEGQLYLFYLFYNYPNHGIMFQEKDLDSPYNVWSAFQYAGYPIVESIFNVELHERTSGAKLFFIGYTRVDGTAQPAASVFYKPADTWLRNDYFTCNYTGQLIKDVFPYTDSHGDLRYLIARSTSGGMLYDVPETWLWGPHTEVVWSFFDILDASEYPNNYAGYGHSQMFGPVRYWVYLNGTLIDDFDDLDDAKDVIDDTVPPTIDDPEPDGWSDEGPYSRFKLRLYFFAVGWALVWLPAYYLGYARGIEKIVGLWYSVLVMFIGLALLWSITEI